jgi:YesN/AraC family two-component response regulator
MNSSEAKILLVDDNVLLLDGMKQILTFANYSVLTAENGEDALKIVNEEGETIDLLITDIKMPKMNGLDLLLKVNQLFPQIKSIVITAHSNPKYNKLANQRGAIVYAEKPIEEADLLDHVKNALNSKRDSGFVGSVQTLTLEDIIQMYCISQLKAALMISRKVNGGLEEGIIYFENGNITNAMVTSEDEMLTGETAFYHIITWEQGTFSTRYGVTTGKKTINQPCQQLLIEALRRKDETNKTESISEDSEETASETEENDGKEVKNNMATRAEQLKEVLTNLSNELADVETIAVVATDGTIFSAVSKVGEDASKVGAIIATIQGLSRRACSTLERGEQKEALIRGEKGYIALYPAGKKASLGITTMPNANLGMLNLTAKEAADKISKILG